MAASYPPPTRADPRSGSRMARWRLWFGRQTAGAAPVDPWARIEIVVLDLDDGRLDDVDGP